MDNAAIPRCRFVRSYRFSFQLDEEARGVILGAHLEIEVTNCYARPLQGSVRRCREKVLAWRPFLRDCAPQGGEKAARKKVCRGSVARCEPEENRVRRSNKHGRDHRFPAKPRDPRIR